MYLNKSNIQIPRNCFLGCFGYFTESTCSVNFWKLKSCLLLSERHPVISLNTEKSNTLVYNTRDVKNVETGERWTVVN